MPSCSLDAAMEADYFGRHPPSDHRLLPGDVPPHIAGERVHVFWWENTHDDAGRVIGRSGRWYPAVVQSYLAATHTLNVRYYEAMHINDVERHYDDGGALSEEIDAIDIVREHVYFVPDETPSPTLRVSSSTVHTRTEARAFRQTNPDTHPRAHADR